MSETKNIIFCTGNVISEYKTIGANLGTRLDRSVTLNEPYSTFDDWQGARELSARKSLFFTHVLFYGGLPSRKNIIITYPNLSIRTVLQFLFLFENVPKKVFFVIDDRSYVTPYTREKFDIFKKFPQESVFFVLNFVDETCT